MQAWYALLKDSVPACCELVVHCWKAIDTSNVQAWYALLKDHVPACYELALLALIVSCEVAVCC